MSHENAIETHGLCHRYGHEEAVHELDLAVPGGAVFGLLGPNGAGKSTTLHMLMGLLPPSAGRMNVLGCDPASDEISVRQRVGFVSEQHGFYETLTVRETVALVSPYYERWNDAFCQHLITEFELDPAQKIRQLSRGMRAKLALLLALSHEPELLVLDEPANGLDPAARRSLIETILKHYQDSGRTILLSSHLLNDFSGLIDHVAFMRAGRLELQTSVEALHERTKRVHLIFDAEPPANVRIPGALSVRADGREIVAVCDRFDEAEMNAALAELQPAQRRVLDLSLEDIFVERALA